MRRADGSCYHTFRFDEATGRPLCANHFDRNPDDKYWARGQAWAVYGLSIAHGYTGGASYRAAAIEIAQVTARYADDSGLVCDNLLDMTRSAETREVSASVILACGLWDLEDGDLPPDLQVFRDRLTATLYSPELVNEDPTVPGILKSRGWPYTSGGISTTSSGQPASGTE